MKSLVLDFENKIIDKSYLITDLLRHCLIIAKKLKQEKFIQWINHELNGYIGIKEIPEYRKVPVSVKFFNQIYGWCPYIITNEEVNNELSNYEFRNSISEIEALAISDNEIIRIEPPTQVKKVFLSSMDFDSDISYEANKISMIKIIDAVKNEMLNWILKLEENNIIDDNYKFDKEQIDQANKITLQIINKFYGNKNKIELSQEVNGK